MHTIEAQLQEILESTRTPQVSASAWASTGTGSSPRGASSAWTSAGHKWTFDPLRPSLYYGPSDGDPFLPPLEVGSRFLSASVSVGKSMLRLTAQRMSCQLSTTISTLSTAHFPLFSQVRVMRLVTGWYGRGSERSRIIWANILTVIALGLQSYSLSDQGLHHGYGRDRDWIGHCARNAQSVMPDLVLRDEDLLGIQVVLGLALVFQNTGDLRPARTLAASAVALSNRMHLHSSDSTQYYSTDETQQRSRVFGSCIFLTRYEASFRTPCPAGFPACVS